MYYVSCEKEMHHVSMYNQETKILVLEENILNNYSIKYNRPL